MTTYLVTGGAGFIGSNLADLLLARGDRVVCVDNFNPFYDPAMKQRNIAGLRSNPQFGVHAVDIRDATALRAVFAAERPTHVAHFAGLANPRRSMREPQAYIEVNVTGTLNVLQAAVEYGVTNLVLASSSSVYGVPTTVPWTESEPADRPLSPYGATKKASEVLAYTYHALHGLPITVIRPFTVFGPRGRPDMTPHLFMPALLRGEPLPLYNGGHGIFRDWTFVGDFLTGFSAALDRALPFEIVNLGNAQPIELVHFVDVLQAVTGLRATIQATPLPPGEPILTYADISKARRLLDYDPQTTLEAGLTAFWHWYQRTVMTPAATPPT